MRTIYKYLVSQNFSLLLPAGSKLLAVQLQGSYPQLWVEQPTGLTDKHKLETRTFVVHPTGAEFDEGRYVGTWQDGSHVWHLYEVPT